MQLLHSKLRFFLILFLLLFSLPGCGDKTEALPYVTVNEYVSIIPTLSNVGVGGHYILPDKGVNGILIYCVDINEYQAFDMTCMYRPRTESCTVEMDSTGYFPKCPCCGSEYNLTIDGLPNIGPTELGLHQYNVFISGNYVQITN
jgi:hypothetical protein